MPVRILLMDIDDTLFDFQTGYKRALRAALAQFGVECTPQLLELYGSINDRLWERFERGEIAKDALYDERFRQLFERCGIDASPAACNEAYHNALRLQHDLMSLRAGPAAAARAVSDLHRDERQHRHPDPPHRRQRHGEIF